MKKKITVKVQINCEKCRRTAMKVASAAGAESVALQGECWDQLLVVIGDQVDPVCLTIALRKKLSHAALVSVEEVKPPAKVEKEAKKEQIPIPICSQTCSRPAFTVCEQYYEPYPSFCSIL